MPFDPLSMLSTLKQGGLSYPWIQQIIDWLNQQQAPAQTDVSQKYTGSPPGPQAPFTQVGDMPLGDKIIPPGPQAPATTPAESPFKQVHVPIPDEKGNYYTQVTNPNYYTPGVGNLYANDAEASLAGKYPDLWNGYLAALKQGEKLAFTEWAQGQLMPKMGLGGWGDMKPTIM